MKKVILGILLIFSASHLLAQRVGIGTNAALGTGTLALTNGSLFADLADRTIANTLTMNNATGAMIGINSLTVATATLT